MNRLALIPLLFALACNDDTGKDDTDVGPTDDTDGGTDDTDVVTSDDDTDVVGETDTGVPGQNITWPDDPYEYEYDAATYLFSFDIPGATQCCRDWGTASKNGNKIDNALASLAGVIEGLAGLDIEATLDETVEGGGFVGLVEHIDIPAGDGKYNMAFFLGDFAAETYYADAAAGDGHFLVSPYSFIDGTGQPQVVFWWAEITDNKLHAAGGEFRVKLPLIGGIELDLPVQDVTIDATILRDSEGVWLEDGDLSGYITLNDFFTTYNGIVDDACGCLGLSTDLFTYNTSTSKWVQHCVGPNEVANCVLPDEELCGVMAGNNNADGYCTTLFSAIPLALDIDVDGNGTWDALSIGLNTDGAPAVIDGTEVLP